MVDILHDIDILENAVIAFTEGASDEKRMALYSLEKLIQEKKRQLNSLRQNSMVDTIVLRGKTRHGKNPTNSTRRSLASCR